MSFGKNELRNKVYSIFTGKTVPTHSCREIAQLIGKEPKDLNQVLKKLVNLNELTRFKEKKNVGPTVYLYTLPDNGKSSNAKKETLDYLSVLPATQKLHDSLPLPDVRAYQIRHRRRQTLG